jgi:LmbE family N-acetylglucosaminyl deacetylase
MKNEPLKIIIIGAHPDDADVYAGGTAALYAQMGHDVKFVSSTNGDAGHQQQGGGALARRRRAEAEEAGRRLGIAEYLIMNHHDTELLPTLEVRHQIIRLIREWKADVVMTHRPYDYHPDHRYTSLAVQDAAYLVAVPNACPDTLPLKKNPLFVFMQDHFQKPYPFQSDIAIAIDNTFDKKIAALDAHVSQFYEWLPWIEQIQDVPEDKPGRIKYLRNQWSKEISLATQVSLEKWYGKEQAANIQYAEAFEICEYGRQPNEDEIRTLFPMLNH